MEFIDLFANNEALRAIVLTTVVLAAADFVLGVSAAIVAKVFNADYITNFIRKHVVGRVFPIITVSVLGVIEPTLFVIAGLAASAYAVETIGSIRDSFNLPREVATAKADYDAMVAEIENQITEDRLRAIMAEEVEQPPQ